MRTRKPKEWVSTGKGKHKIFYNTTVLTFDIEVSSFKEGEEKRSVVYSWAICENGEVWTCRTREEFVAKIDEIKNRYIKEENHRVIIWVHNLSYEYQFIKRLFVWHSVMAVNNARKILKAVTIDGIEFRCSYMLTQSSLLGLTKGTEYEKKCGDLDYELVRTPETPLTKEEEGYIKYDVLGLWDYMTKEIKKVGTIVDLPYTKTGYVRKYCREHMTREDRDTVGGLSLKAFEYSLLSQAFVGGYVHGNADYCNEVLTGVTSLDFTSSYPSRMLEYRYPMDMGRRVIVEDEEDLEFYKDMYCVLLTVKLTGLRCITPATYISKSKTLENGKIYLEDNGRIFSAEWITLTITDVDFEIIKKAYKIEKIEILDCYIYRKGYLPKSFLECVIKFYKDKTTLKGVAGEESNYQIMKGMLNSTYGMCVTNPLHPDFKNHNGDLEKIELTEEAQKKAIEKENSNNKRFLFYPWGVWITAYARKSLMDVVLQLGDDWVYSDTDSIKLKNAEKYKDIIEKADAETTERLKKCCEFYGFNFEDLNPKDIKGNHHQLGVFTNEGTYDRFKTMGAKRYLYEEEGEIHLTNSGINKKKGAEYLKGIDSAGNKIRGNAETVDAFEFYNEELTIPAEYAGHTVSRHIDEATEGNVVDYLGNVYHYKEPTGLHIEKADYHMALSDVYNAFRLSV